MAHSRKVWHSLHSPWISISRTWLQVEALATFKLGNGIRIAFWLDPWLGPVPLNICFPRLFRIALFPNGLVAEHWDILSSSWSLIFQRLLKDDEIADFPLLLSQIPEKRVTENFDIRVWSLDTSGVFSVKSLLKHSVPSSPLDNQLYKALWKSKSPRLCYSVS